MDALLSIARFVLCALVVLRFGQDSPERLASAEAAPAHRAASSMQRPAWFEAGGVLRG